MRPTRNKTPARPQKTPHKLSRPNSGSMTKHPVQVFCRLRPMQKEYAISCMKIISPTTLYVSPPDTAMNFKSGNVKEMQYVFKHIFPADATQNEVFNGVALPLVEELIRGRNGLLFTYGVTGSGKTFTMTGDHMNRGIMPRSLDVLYRTISNFQAKKFVFKPDKMNGFDIQSEEDACLERQAELHSKIKYPKTPKRTNSDLDLAPPSVELSAAEGVEEDNMYAVFISYIEIYNNMAYDLLEDNIGSNLRSLQSRMIREDSVGNMYVNGVNEVECKSVEDALEVFYRGKKRKQMAHTILNAESSRSHSVFTIRLVQAPTDNMGENVIPDKNVVCISQLSLVDLAGSERTNRSKNTGVRLREAGNINNSLMTLRSCLEILRENQMTGGNKMVPYRDSKITHLFKNYFDGDGQVRMIVCANPRAEDYDETIQVMKFAELSQEVQVSRPAVVRPDIALTPGRRKANQIFKQAVQNLEVMGKPDARKLEVDLGLVYSLGPMFPSFEMDSPQADNVIQQLMNYLELRIAKRDELQKDLQIKQDQFRNRIVEMERENIMCRTESNAMKAVLEQERRKRTALESKVIDMESSIDTMHRRFAESESTVEGLRKELAEKAIMLNQKILEKERMKHKFNNKIATEAEKMSRELDQKLRRQKALLKNEMHDKDEKIRIVSEILKTDRAAGYPISSSTTTVPSSVCSTDNLPTVKTYTATNENVENRPPNTPYSSRRGVAVANPRHRRSRSASGDVWLDHRGPTAVPLGTVLQPSMKKRKSVTKLTDVKDIANDKTSKYCLMTQEQDTDGELETKLYKGDVIPSCGGGAQVIFNDVETLTQSSPNSSPARKRANSNIVNNLIQDFENIESRCSIAIEGNKRSKI